MFFLNIYRIPCLFFPCMKFGDFLESYLQSEGAIHPSSMAVHDTSTWYFQWLGTYNGLFCSIHFHSTNPTNRSTQAPVLPVARHHYCYYRSLKPGERKIQPLHFEKWCLNYHKGKHVYLILVILVRLYCSEPISDEYMSTQNGSNSATS